MGMGPNRPKGRAFDVAGVPPSGTAAAHLWRMLRILCVHANRATSRTSSSCPGGCVGFGSIVAGVALVPTSGQP